MRLSGLWQRIKKDRNRSEMHEKKENIIKKVIYTEDKRINEA